MLKLLKTKIIFLCATLTLSLALPVQSARADIDPKIKALGVMSAYGTIGGALLGTATLAFDGKARNIAIGASLGLYAGILFGAYVIVTHEMKKAGPQSPRRDNYYPNAPTPYNAPYGQGPYGEDPYGGSGGGDYGSDYGAGQRWNPLWLEEVAQVKVEFGADYFEKAQDKAWRPSFQMELVRFSF